MFLAQNPSADVQRRSTAGKSLFLNPELEIEISAL
jgi:hypothetical protein